MTSPNDNRSTLNFLVIVGLVVNRTGTGPQTGYKEDSNNYNSGPL
jgi:hypothetical protein